MRGPARLAGVLLLAASCSPTDSSRSRAGSVPPRAPVISVAGGTVVDTLLQRGDAVYRQSPDSARRLWERALERARASGDSAGIARSLTGLGQAAWHLGDFGSARRLGEAALDLKGRLRLRGDLFRSYNALGLLAWDEERLADASTLFAQAADAARAAGDSSAVARATINTGLVLDDRGRFGDARRALETGRDLARAAGDSVNLGRALTNLAKLDIALGNPVAAVTGLEAARRLFRATGDSIGEVNAVAQLATARDALGEVRDAFAAFDTAQRMASRLGLRREEADNLELIGDLFDDAGDHRHALDYYARALAINDTLGRPEERGEILRSEARSHAGLGNQRLAMQRALDALGVHRAGGFRYPELRDRLFLAELTQEMGRASDADTHLRAARVLAESLDVSVASARVALTEARVALGAGAPRRALRVIDDARISLPLLGTGVNADALALRARAFDRLGRPDSAAAAGRRAIAAVERVRENYQSGELRTSYASRKSSVYADQVLRLLQLDRAEEAFQVADAARGRALLEHLAAARADIRNDDRTRDVLEREDLLRRIDAIVARLREREPRSPRERTPAFLAATKELSDSLVAARTAYEALLARAADRTRSRAGSFLGAGASQREVQGSLRPEEALLEYFVTPGRLLIFVVTRSRFAVRVSPEDAVALASRVRLARELIQQPVADDAARAVLGALYGAILAPAEASGALRGVTRLIVVPHGVLTYLPFAALIDGATGKFTVEKYAVLHAATAGAFVAMRRAGDERRGGAAGAPGGAVFAPFPDELPATRAESRSFLRAIPRSVAHVGVAATEARLRSALQSGAIVHVAGHAVMNARNPLFSRIELAGDRGAQAADDGRLEVHELLGLRSASPLVFLSGCETALGAAWSTPFDAGEDFTTIGQALLYAGARNVVATLWRIDDAAAAEFARRFYESLRTLPPAESLARTQRAMIADPRLRNPYLWAAYQVSGSGDGPAEFARARVASDKPSGRGSSWTAPMAFAAHTSTRRTTR